MGNLFYFKKLLTSLPRSRLNVKGIAFLFFIWWQYLLMVSTEKGTLRYDFCTNIGQVSSSCHIMEWPIMDDTYYSQCTVCMVRRRHCFYYDTRESTNNKSSICEFFQCQGKSECNILTRVYLLLNTLPSSRDSWYFIYIKHTFVLLYTSKICSSYM